MANAKTLNPAVIKSIYSSADEIRLLVMHRHNGTLNFIKLKIHLVSEKMLSFVITFITNIL